MAKGRSLFLTTHSFQQLQVGNTTVSYLKEGQGEPILLVHGGGTWSYTWRRNITALAKHFTVYVLDMPGFGLTITKERFKPTEDYFAHFIKEYLDVVGLQKISIVGSSWGGGWALRFTELYPDYVKKLVVIGSAGLFYHKLKRPTFLWNLINIPGFGRIISRYFTTPAILKSQYKSLVVDPSTIDKNTGNELYIGLKNPRNRDVLYEYGLRDMWCKTDDNLDKITQPLLLIWGENDTMLTIADAYTLKKRLPHAKLEVLSNVGHLPHEEVPESVNKLLIAFMKDKYALHAR